MEQILHNFCQNYVPLNKPQSEVEARIDEFLTDERNVSNRCRAETLQSAAASSGAQPPSDSLSSLSQPSLSISPLLPPACIPHVCSVVGGRADKPQSAPAVQKEEADFTVVDRKEKKGIYREAWEHTTSPERNRGEHWL